MEEEIVASAGEIAKNLVGGLMKDLFDKDEGKVVTCREVMKGTGFNWNGQRREVPGRRGRRAGWRKETVELKLTKSLFYEISENFPLSAVVFNGVR